MKRSRVQLAGPLGGFVVGVLVAGLLAPLLFADRDGPTATQVAASNGPASAAAGALETSGEDGAAGPGTSATVTGARPGSNGAAPSGTGTAVAPSGEGGAGAPAGGALTASDRGVTESAIRIGVPIIDLGSLAEYGIDTETSGIEEQKLTFNSIIASYNEAGGVHGRQLEPVFEPYDPLDQDDMRASCQALAEDAQVFAVTAQAFYGDPILCLTERFKTPIVLDDGTSDEFYRRSGGLLFSTQMGKARSIRNQIWMLHTMGLLKGKTLGALVSEINGDADAPDEALKQTLAQFGYDLAHEARFTSIEALPSEIPLHVQQMKAKGVDFVIATQTSALWNDEAERQDFRPQYSVSDFSQKTRDSSVEDHGEHWDGTIGITGTLWADNGGGAPETAATRSCLDRAAAHGSGPYERGEILYDVQVGVCNVLDTFVRGATAAGPNLTRAGFAQATANLGPLDLGNMNAAAFRPGKYDAPETVRATRWELACTCYKPIGEFVVAQF